MSTHRRLDMETTKHKTIYAAIILGVVAVIFAFFAGTFVSPALISKESTEIVAKKDTVKAISDAEKAADAADTAAASARKAADSTKQTAASAEKSASDTADSAKAAEQFVNKVK